ncbi:glycosyltransferase family 1 protein [Pedobacter sp. L105]|uniref:glycosyltransferase family 4 protein n=1 Tax=Pedobacter sp. L105 TaxID=1641871 RepID=UPI00131B1811|nr:glycosyltransferase family 1 protein [Pedobacter sp. L105]
MQKRISDSMNNPLIIGIDIRDLSLAKTGTKTYLAELCSAFKLLENEHYHFHFLDSGSHDSTSSKGSTNKYAEHFRYHLWKQVILPYKAWRNHCDILFCTDNFVPLLHLGYQTVPVFHDAFFFENPEHYGKLWLKLYHLTAIPAAKRSAFIVTPTLYAQQQIHRYTSIPLEKLKVIYEGPKTMEPLLENHFTERFNLKDKDYILHVGSMFKRKNIPALIRAFRLLKDKTGTKIKLVLAGPSSASKDSNDYNLILEAITSLQLQDEVILTGYLSDNELASIYNHALLYVFPSVNEGFGIPILEAFKYQLPVLVANNSCLPEVGGDAVLTFDPFNPEDICTKIIMVIENETLRKELIQKGKIRLKDFSWQKTAIQLLELFKTLKTA